MNHWDGSLDPLTCMLKPRKVIELNPKSTQHLTEIFSILIFVSDLWRI